MKVSSKSRYALMALVELDLRTRGTGKPVRLTDLARERGIPEQFLEQLFAGLRRAGLLTGRRGAGGGFAFARRPDQLTVLDIVEALDGCARQRVGLRGLGRYRRRPLPAPSGARPARPSSARSPARP